jgi:hypothetical protein
VSPLEHVAKASELAVGGLKPMTDAEAMSTALLSIAHSLAAIACTMTAPAPTGTIVIKESAPGDERRSQHEALYGTTR